MTTLPAVQAFSLPQWPLYAVLALILVAMVICALLGIRDLVVANRLNQDSNNRQPR